MAVRFLLCALILITVAFDSDAFPDFIEENGLNINGSNVCKYPTSKTTNVTHKAKFVLRFPYIAPCPGIFGYCLRFRIKIEKVEQVVLQKVHGYALRCCHRWKKIKQYDNDCLKPICIHGCQHGKCVGGDTCSCDSGWRGYTCGQDVNECYEQNGGCQQECHNAAGSYMCGCRRGYRLDANDTTKCLDINECKAPQPHCLCASGSGSQCNATCVNSIGNFKCICSKGYRLNGANTCDDIDECLSSITNDCSHKCVNTPGSYNCTCFKGFKYNKNGNCEDVNECAISNGGCEQRCINTYGSSRCRCKRGYRLATDRKKCRPFKAYIPPPA